MTAPLITVLITTYNYGQFLDQAINSILSQDFPLDKIQILVIDDGSTDDTSERVKKYGSRVEYFYKPNGGQASALNFGIARARGEIIALLDADDLFLPVKLSRIAEAFGREPGLGMVYHRLQEWTMSTDERRSWEFVEVSGDIHNEPEKFVSYVPQPTSAISFRRSSLNPLLPVPEEIRMLADCYLVALISFLAPVLAIPELLAVYRIHGKNSYSTEESHVPVETMRNRVNMWQILIDAMRKWLAYNGYSRRQTVVRCFLDRWTLHQEKQRFLIKPPGRLRFFKFVVLENYVASSIQTWKLTTFNYLYSLSALVFGYNRADRFYEWRRRIMETFQSLFRRSSRESE
jgi:glycosyltransferase involved in cell wall biosynthesis